MGKDIATVEVWARLTALSDDSERNVRDILRWEELIGRLEVLAEEFADIEMSLR